MGNILGWRKSDEETAWNAAKTGDLDALMKLSASNAPVLQAQEKERGETPLAIASSNGHVHCVRWLVEKNVDIYRRDYQGNTPLHLACMNGHPCVVEFLLRDAAYTPYVQNTKGQSPLDVARAAYEQAKAAEDAANNLGDFACCIYYLEERLQVFQGQVLQEEDNLASSVFFGFKGLRSWNPKHALVLRTSSPLYLELALFNASNPAEARTTVPSSSILVRVERGTKSIIQATKSSWLKGKPFAFELLGTAKSENVGKNETKQFAFAALDETGLNDWVSMFEYAVTVVQDPSVQSPDMQFNTNTLGWSQLAPQTSLPEANVDEVVEVGGVEIAQPVLRNAEATPSGHTAAGPTCVVCLDDEQSTVCVPCGHNAMCLACAERIMESSKPSCPICRNKVREVIKLYRCA